MEPLYTYYDINTCDIWRHEHGLFLNKKSSEETARKVLHDIRLIIAERAKPRFGLDNYNQQDQQYKRYYQGKVDRYIAACDSLERSYSIEYFFFKDGCYQYDHDIIIDRTEKDFEFWFALKLRQYDGKISCIDGFLAYQLEKNFNNDLKAFSTFLKINIRQFKGELFTDRIIETVNEWIETTIIKEKAREAEEQDDSDKKEDKENDSFEEARSKGLKIHADYQGPVIQALLPFFDEKEHELLVQLIKGAEINDKIYFQSNANQFITVFRQLHLNQKVIGGYIDTEKWIHTYFNYKNRQKGRSAFVRDNVHKLLSKHSYSIPKEKRIDIPGLTFIKQKSK